ncbi:MAG: 2-oxoacid:acceptor oxidoreductase subunit alpha [Flavobacteriales bacterium]|nr:2-oxoacid:acceptor oxidoreductase subunit alpha [Flavobacteriales bacterium]
MSDNNIKINDFVIRFANVNGTGSASANSMFAKSVFRMGIPITGKNIFPSNIQGLPTWYEVRVSEKGYLGRKEGIDIMVGLNPQSLERDVRSVKPGGYFMYDSTKLLHKEYRREDINYIGIPMMEICIENYTDPRLRQLFKNIIYVGALTTLLNIDIEIVKGVIADEFSKKPKLIEPNVKALLLGVEYVERNFEFPLNVYCEKRDLVKDKIVIDGNSASGLGAIYAGATVAAWYPITPSTSLVNAFENFANKLRIDEETGRKKFAILQAEDELAAIGMVIGASWNGARAFTSTSGPGVSLMNEFLGLAYFAEIPTVLYDVQRAGPSTGMPTRTQQSDVLICAYASHGDTKQVLLFPSTPRECFDLSLTAFDLAEQLQTPVIVMLDLDLGMNDHLSEPFRLKKGHHFERGKVVSTEDLENGFHFGRYLDVDGDGISYRTIPATHPTMGANVTRGTSRNEYARYTEDEREYVKNMDKLIRKWESAKSYVPGPEINESFEHSKNAILYFGTTLFPAVEALDMLRENGHELNSIRILSFPFNQEVKDFIDRHDTLFVVEQNRDAQMRTLLMNEMDVDPKKLIKVLNYDGLPITADHICREIMQNINKSEPVNLN